MQDIVKPDIQKHEPCASIDYEDLDSGLFFESSDDEDDDNGDYQEFPMNDPSLVDFDMGE